MKATTGGVWWQQQPRREGVDLVGDVRRGGGAQHTSPDGEVLTPWSPTTRIEARDDEPDPGRWWGA